jgi:hypothetical protein
MKKLQELWTRFKVQISFIGGALVVMLPKSMKPSKKSTLTQQIMQQTPLS